MKYERGIVLQAETNPKAFLAYTRKQLKTKSGVAPLLSDPANKDSMIFDGQEKANTLQEQFTSVFTREPEGDVPTINCRTNTILSNMSIRG